MVYKLLVKYFETELGAAQSVRVIKDLDNRMSRLAPFPGLKTFHNGVMTKKKMRAYEYEQIIVQLPLVLYNHPDVPEEFVKPFIHFADVYLGIKPDKPKP